jgi:hypothetical protein
MNRDEELRNHLDSLLSQEPAPRLDLDTIERRGRAKRRQHLTGRAAVVLTTLAVAGGAVWLVLPDRSGPGYATDPTPTATASPSPSVASTEPADMIAETWAALVAQGLAEELEMSLSDQATTRLEDVPGAVRYETRFALRRDDGTGVDVVIAAMRGSNVALEAYGSTPQQVRAACENGGRSECIVLDQGIDPEVEGIWMETMSTDSVGRGFAEHHWRTPTEYASVSYMPVGVQDSQELFGTEVVGRWLNVIMPKPWNLP